MSFAPSDLSRYEKAGGTPHLLSMLIRGGHDAIDTNAGDGVVAAMLANIASQVHVFETHPGKLRVLQRTMALNVAVHPEALAAYHGEVVLEVVISADLRRAPTAEADKIVIRLGCITLDDFARDPIDLVLMQSDGREMDVIAGAARLIESRQTSFLCRMTDRASALVLSAFFKEMGYDGLLFAGGEISTFGGALKGSSDAVFFSKERGLVREEIIPALQVWSARALLVSSNNLDPRMK